MNVLITGSTGLIGQALARSLSIEGHQIFRLAREKNPQEPNKIYWDGETMIERPERLAEMHAVVHLAGESIAGGRWTAAKKRRIRDSRVKGTTLLAETLAKLPKKPEVLVCASAIGFYGDRGDEVLDESSAPGSGFLPDVCRAWEAAAEPARQAGIRTVHLRNGIVLSTRGGALKQMLPAFQFGLAGKIGSGRQYWSWITLDDTIGAIQHAIANDTVRGVYNGVSPAPVTNAEFTKTLGRVLRRPTVLPLPGFAARIVLGEMAKDLLLASARVMPAALKDSGFRFRYPDLENALVYLLNK